MTVALILAAGNGTRMGNVDKPKQFLLVYNKPLLIHTIEAFEVNDKIDKIFVVTNFEYLEQVKIWCKQYDLSKVCGIIQGGDSRQASVYNGLQFLKEYGIRKDDTVLIHDSARPLISQTIISENILACSKYDAVDTVIPSSDTIVKSISGEEIVEIPQRNELYLGQTPQTFKFGLILDAHESAKNANDFDTTDDCKLLLKKKIKIAMVNGSKLNFKITTFDDLIILKALLKIGKTEVL